MLFGRNDLKIGGAKVSMYYPISKLIPNEKVLFRDISQYVSISAILEFLNYNLVFTYNKGSYSLAYELVIIK